MVALCFAELASRYPVAGSIYNWSKRLTNPHVAWLAGWMMLTASIVTIAAVALGYQLTLPQISTFFQFYGDGTGKYDFAANAVILGTALIIFTTVINAYGVKLMARINSSGVFIEIVAAVLLIVALAVNITRGPGVAVRHAGARRGLGARLPRRVPGRLARLGLRDVRLRHGELARARSRSTRAATRRARSCARSIASFVIGGLILLFAILSVRRHHRPGAEHRSDCSTSCSTCWAAPSATSSCGPS